jgi:diguanylate cyclase (GGDEF)-like protein
MFGDDRVGSGSYVLLINIAMAAIVAAGFLFAYLHDRRRVQALCWIGAACLVILNGAIEAIMPHLSSLAPLRVIAFACFMGGLGLLGLGFSHQYRVKFLWGPAITVFAAGVIVNIAILDMARTSPLRMFLYQTPYFLMGSLAAMMLLRARHKTLLDYLLLCVMALFNLHFLTRPLTARLLGGMGDSASAYLSTPYAAFDQTVLAIIGMTLTALMSLVLVRDVIRSLTKASLTDPLSGLLNRRGFEERARSFIGASRGASQNVFLAIADIDHFKAINDTHGHETGDKVIQAFGALLDTLAASGTSVARVGGEEFAILFHSPNMPLARLYCESIRTAAEVGAADKDRALPPFTASFGLAGLVSGESLESLTRRADLALYSAKQGGRNKVAIADSIVSESLAA